MALTEAQVKAALSLLQVSLNPLMSERARVTIGPVLVGPISRGEFQAFIGSSNYGPVNQSHINGAYRQIRTLNIQCVLQLSDLSDQAKAIPILEQAKELVVGIKPFGSHIEAPYQGALYPTGDSFTRLETKGGGFTYLYAQSLACQIHETLPDPT